ncbi:MAG TPA: aldolase [Terriglobia bacterium]|nr:aldolase [Terriglobia bacterium]
MANKPRFNRLFGRDGKCIEVALDHGIHNEWSFLPGIENLRITVDKLVAADPDAILLSIGQAQLLQEYQGRQKPTLVVRIDPTNLYGVPTPGHVFCELIDEPVEQALALDAASVVVNLLWAPDQPELYHQCIKNICRLKPHCERFGMPLMVEPLAMHRDDTVGYRPDPDTCRNVALVRQAVELGADILKTDSFEDLDEYGRIIEAASGRPVLPRGGSRVSDEEILRRTFILMEKGASGIVYGRNIFQHPRPERMVKACRAMVHQGATVQEAMAILSE